MSDNREGPGAIRLTNDGKISLEGTSEKWSRRSVAVPSGQLTLNSLVQEMPGDKFSKLVLSMHNYFRTIETAAASNKRYVLSRIADVQILIGVVAEPEFLEEDHRFVGREKTQRGPAFREPIDTNLSMENP